MEIKILKKICLDCRGDLPLEEFHISLSCAFGVVSACKFCMSHRHNNKVRKKKGLPLFSANEYKAYYSRKSYKKDLRTALEVKIERLFQERRIKALQAHRVLELLKKSYYKIRLTGTTRTTRTTQEVTAARKETNRLKEVIKIIKQDN